MRFSLAKCCFWKAERSKETLKMHEKNAVPLEKKRSDIFPSLGLPLCALALQNAGFGTAKKSKGTLKN